MLKIVLFAALAALACASIPASFDARTNWEQCDFFILNQEQCGSCWDFCSMESFADRLCITGEAPAHPIISPQPVLDCSGQGCDGGFPSTAWNWCIQNGNSVCTEQCFSGCVPYDSGDGSSQKCHAGKCDSGTDWSETYVAGSYMSLSGLFNHDLPSYQTALMDNGPLQACFTVFENFYTFFSLHPEGTYVSASGQNLGGHCVKMTGWGTDDNGQDYWEFANSWDTTWGNGGYFRMARGNNLCNIEGQVSQGMTQQQTAEQGVRPGIHPNVRLTEKKVGGWTPQADPSHPMNIEAAVAGLEVVSKNAKRQFTYQSLLSAETQVVAGVNFKLVVKSAEGETISMRVYRDLKMDFHLVHHDLMF